MAKFFGKVGYEVTAEQAKGVYEPQIEERNYFGDVIRNTRRLDNNEYGVNDNVQVNNSISIVADAYAYEHFFAIRYVEWMGAHWKVTNVEVQRPRLILSIGGVYNG